MRDSTITINNLPIGMYDIVDILSAIGARKAIQEMRDFKAQDLSAQNTALRYANLYYAKLVDAGMWDDSVISWLNKVYVRLVETGAVSDNDFSENKNWVNDFNSLRDELSKTTTQNGEQKMKRVKVIDVMLNDVILRLPDWARFVRYDHGLITASLDGESFVDVCEVKIKSLPHKSDIEYEIAIDQEGRYVAIDSISIRYWLNYPKPKKGENDD